MKIKIILFILLTVITIWTGYLIYTFPVITARPEIKNNTLSEPLQILPPSPQFADPGSTPSQPSNKIKCPACSFINESTDRYCLNCARELWKMTQEESIITQQKNRQLLHQRNQRVSAMVEKEKAFIVRRNLFFSSKEVIERLKKMEAYKDIKKEEMDNLLTDIAKCYKLIIHYTYEPADSFLQSLKPDKIEALAPEFKDVIHTLNMVDEFFSPYPADLIRKEIQDLYFISSLKINGKPAAGLALCGRKKFLISCNSSHNRIEILKIFHHEFTHLVVGQNIKIFPLIEWQKANPPGWKYKQDYWTSKTKNNSNQPNEKLFKEGFIREYGQESVEEDIATISEELFTDTEKILRLSKQYPSLNKKINLLIQFFSRLGVKFNLPES